MIKTLCRSLLAPAAICFATASLTQAGMVDRELIPITAEAPESEFRLTLTANSWLTNMTGDIGLRRLQSEVDIGMVKMLSKLNLAYMGYMEVGYRRWSIGLDVNYARLSNHFDYDYGPIDGSMHLKMTQAFITGRLQYRVVDSEPYKLELYAGARWNYLRTKVDIQSAFHAQRPAFQRFNRNIRRDFNFRRDWFDPIIGLRNVYHITPEFYLQVEGDIGGFGVGSELTWQALAGVGYQFTRNFSTFTAYRAMGIDYREDDFKLDVISHGPMVSFILRF